MTQVTLRREARAEQWLGDIERLPEGAHVCQPEVHWSASRELIYFTYADLPSKHWLEIEERQALPDDSFLAGALHVKRKDGSEYYRQAFPFAFYEIKSESSVNRDWRAVYLDESNIDALATVFADYVSLEKWSVSREPGFISLPPRAEYRVGDGGYGRGFRPYYMKPGDWLLHERDSDGRPAPRVVSNDEFEKFRGDAA